MSGQGVVYRLSWLVSNEYEHTMECRGLSMRGREHEFAHRSDFPEEWPEDATFTAEGSAPEDVPFCFHWPLVSDGVRMLVESNGLTGVRFYPVEIESHLPVPIPRYWYAHFTHLAGAIDMDRSTYTYLDLSEAGGGQMLTVLKHVLKRRVIEGWDLFRCAEQKFSFFCSERFRDLFVGNGFTGLGFSPVRVSD